MEIFVRVPERTRHEAILRVAVIDGQEPTTIRYQAA
jgi:flagellar motor switch protein FliG